MGLFSVTSKNSCTVDIQACCKSSLGVDGEIFNNNMAREGNNAAIGALPPDQESYNIFNGTMTEMNDFVNMNSP